MKNKKLNKNFSTVDELMALLPCKNKILDLNPDLVFFSCMSHVRVLGFKEGLLSGYYSFFPQSKNTS